MKSGEIPSMSSRTIFLEIVLKGGWREFQYVGGEPFLAVPNNFGLMLNVDRFQPTLHGSDLFVASRSTLHCYIGGEGMAQW